ncbi:glutathione S-transferase family protein [Sphingomonas panacisoli]|uniref:Glutathione S-transferase family protein n=1 Tax=Sphingomonas panacisoli TaxID=1813879 RepID=A0A5B8LM81_9SPHN|nr:glutathione S-transferase family protein [Sphingomonas panacisoli]QDZ08694.1 glutathione S-transferase family protein [Sphingomonas panacisoli]
MIVYGSTLSPFVRKVMAYLAEKGLSAELKPSGMGRGGPEFEEASPFGKMPAFRDPGADNGHDFVISDSTAIITYLEAKHPEPAMIPADPANRARTIWFEEFGDTMVAATGGKVFFNRIVAPKFMKVPGDEAAAQGAVETEMPRLFDYLERTIPDSGFLVGDRMSLADISVASPFVNYAHCQVGPNAARWPRTVAYLDAILARPSFATMIEGERQMVAALG